MNTPKHTPGPWVSTGPHTREVVTYNTGTYRPAMTIATVNGYWDGEALANMHLIVAAPAMYLELKEGLVLLEASHHDMVDMYGTDSLQAKTVWERIESTRNTLAQAEGTL